MNKNSIVMKIKSLISPKLWAFFLVAILFLAACSNSIESQTKKERSSFQNQDINQNSASKQFSGNILLWHDETINEAQAQQTVRNYQQINPDVNIIVEIVRKEELLKRFLQQFRAGLSPNILLVDYDLMFEFIRVNSLMAIDPKIINLGDILPTALTQVTYQDKVYGIPGAIFTQVLCYNKNKVNKNQLPQNLDDILSQAKAGYTFGIPSSFQDTFWGIQIFGGEIFDNQGRFSLKSGSWAAWMTWLQLAKTIPNVILSSSIVALEKSFIEGNLDYFVCDASSIFNLKKALVKDNLGVTILPGQPEHPAGPLLYSKVLVIPNNFSSRQTAITLNFARFITNKQQQQRGAMDIGSFIPPNKTILLDRRLFPIQATLEEQARNAVAIPLRDIPQAEIIFPIGETLYQQILEGTISPKEGGEQLLQLSRQALQQ
jgi:arabinogalactan oligomer / maltooligosaccharide transport system substrate-binding protein